MQVVENIAHIPAGVPSPVVAIGVFDGVHLGHQEILRRIVARAADRQGTAVVLSFYPHPQKIIAPERAPALLQTFSQRAEMMEQLGVDFFVKLPFNRTLSLLTPREFVVTTLGPTGVKEVHVGGNFRFGRGRQGDIQTLETLGEEFGFQVHRTTPVWKRGSRISSTRIRMLIQDGRVAAAKRLLGRPYEIRGNVVRGAEKGAQLGFPTANLKCDNELIPATGVYASRVRLGDRDYIGATNIGFRPTVHGYSEPEPTIETHILGFSDSLYGQALKLEICFRLRDEKKFESVESLIAQIDRDLLGLRRYSAWVRQLWREK